MTENPYESSKVPPEPVDPPMLGSRIVNKLGVAGVVFVIIILISFLVLPLTRGLGVRGAQRSGAAQSMLEPDEANWNGAAQLS